MSAQISHPNLDALKRRCVYVHACACALLPPPFCAPFLQLPLNLTLWGSLDMKLLHSKKKGASGTISYTSTRVSP